MRQLGKFGLALLFVLAVAMVSNGTVTAAPTHAPTAEEQKAFAEGLRAYETGDARGAERAWKAGYALARDPAFLVRIGEAQEKAGAPKEAVQTYEQYLRESPDAADRADIEARVRRLAPPDQVRASTEGDAPGEAEPGVLSPDQAKPANSEAPMATPAPATSPPRRAQARDDGHEELVPLIEEEQERSTTNVAAWAGTGVTVVLLGVAAFFGARAAEHAGDANRLLLHSDETTGVPLDYATYGRQFEDEVRDGQRADRLAKGFLVAAGVTAVASTVLFILDARAEKTAPTVARRGGGLRLAPAGLLWSF